MVLALSATAYEYVSLRAFHESSCHRLIKVWIMNKVKSRRTGLRGKSIRKNMDSLINRSLGFHHTRCGGHGDEMLCGTKPFMGISDVACSSYFRAGLDRPWSCSVGTRTKAANKHSNKDNLQYTMYLLRHCVPQLLVLSDSATIAEMASRTLTSRFASWLLLKVERFFASDFAARQRCAFHSPSVASPSTHELYGRQVPSPSRFK